MKVALLTPWENAWVPYFREAIEARGHQFKRDVGGADVVLHGWSSGLTQPVAGARNIFFMRRYELFDGGLTKVDWRRVDALIVVNAWIKEVVGSHFQQNKISTPVHLIYNGTDLGRWRFKNRCHGKNIGMACHVHPKKNLPLAVQILGSLGEDYELHIAGEVQDSCTAEYLNDLSKRLKRRVFLYGHIEHEQMNLWWEQMNYCLSTSISEGNPNNVIEAMAKGIKPIVHDWPGAGDQFPDDLRFTTVARAVDMIAFEKDYESQRYRDLVQYKFSLANIERVVDIALEGLT